MQETIEQDRNHDESDIVWGVTQIGREIGLGRYQVFYRIRLGLLPVVRHNGRRLYTSKQELWDYFFGLCSAA